MKRKFFLFFIVALVSINAFAQSNEQRLVGTWIDLHDGEPLILNANGTMSGWDSFTHWAAAGDSIIFYIPNRSSDRTFARYQISSDGRTLIRGERAFRRST